MGKGKTNAPRQTKTGTWAVHFHPFIPPTMFPKWHTQLLSHIYLPPPPTAHEQHLVETELMLFFDAVGKTVGDARDWVHPARVWSLRVSLSEVEIQSLIQSI